MTRLAIAPPTLGLRLGQPTLDPLTLSAARAAARRAQQPQVTPEQERGILGTVLGGVEYLGGVLDKPGAAVRGVASGLTDLAQGDSTPDWGGGLLNLVPWSDTIGLTNRSERISGRDVLENVGILGANKPGLGINGWNPTDWDWGNLGGDLAGFGAEVAMDPLSYVTGPLGTLMKGAKPAELASPVAKATAAAKAAGQEIDLKTLAGTFKEALPAGAMSKPMTLDEAVKAGAVTDMDAVQRFMANNFPSAEELAAGKRATKVTDTFTEGLASGYQGKWVRDAGGTPRLEVVQQLGSGQAVTTPISLANQIRTGERGLIGMKAPRFVNSLLGLEDVPFAQLGAGSETAAKWTEAAAYGRLSPVRWARGVFGKPTYNIWSGADQKIADMLYGEKDRLLNLMDDMYPTVARESTRLMDELTEIGRHTGLEQPEVRRAFDDIGREMILENPNAPLPKDQVQQALAEKMGLSAADPGATPWLDSLDDLTDRYYGYFETLRSTEDAMGKYYQSLGGSLKFLEDEFVDHFGRRPSAKLRGEFAFKIMREPYLRDFPGGTVGINDVARDWRLTATGQLAPGSKTPLRSADTLKGEIAKSYLEKRGTDPTIPSVARAAKRGTKNQFKAYTEDADAAGLKPWERTMIPNPQDTTLKELQKRYLWDFHYKPALDKQIARRGLEGEEAAAFFNDQANLAWFGKEAAKKEDALPPKLDQMIEGFGKLPKAVLENGLFDRSTATDYFDYMNSAVKAVANMGYLHSLMKQKGIMKVLDSVDDPGAGNVLLNNAWWQTRLTKQGLRTLTFDAFNDKIGGTASYLGQGALDQARAMRAEGRTLDEIADALGRAKTEGIPKDQISYQNGDYLLMELEELAGRVAIPESATGLFKGIQQTSSPKFESAMLDTFDKITASFKGYWTIPWPSFHSRNLGAAVFQEMSEGRIPWKAILRGKANAAKYLRTQDGLEYIDEIKALKLLEGKGIATDIAADEAVAALGDVIPVGPTGGIASSLGPKRFMERAAERYDTEAPTLLQAMKANFDPLASRGVNDTVPANIMQDTGEKAYRTVEFIARAGYYDELRKAGYSPSQAVHYVNRTHFDYGAMNPFEKGVMKRAMPFYAWTSKSLPYTMAKILEYPGGPTAQAFRAVNRGDEQDGVYTPKWMQEQIAAPVSGTPEAQTFVRSFGLPIEDYNRFVFDEGTPNAPRMLETFGSNLHPLLTMPIEQIAGKQLFSGRKLKDLESPTENYMGTRLRPVDVALSRGPWSRFVSSGMDVLNPDKPATWKLLNLTTGVKSSTVDTEKARMIDLVNQQREKLDAYPEIRQTSHFYLNPKYDNTPIGESRQEDLALLNALQRLQKQVLKEKERLPM